MVKEAINMAQTIWSYECDLLIIDNITYHFVCGSINIAQVIALIDNKLSSTSIV